MQNKQWRALQTVSRQGHKNFPFTWRNANTKLIVCLLTMVVLCCDYEMNIVD